MLETLTERMLSDWPAALAPKPRSLSYLGLPGAVEGGTTTFLAFGTGDAKPVFAVKVHRFSDSSTLVKRERAVLDHLAARPPLAATVPRVILSGEIDGCWTIVQTILAGRTMPVRMAGDGLPDVSEAEKQFQDVTEWLLALRAAGRDLSGGTTRFTDSWPERIDRFERLPGCARADRSLLADLRRWTETSGDQHPALAHGDFSRQNVLVDGGRVNVIDWTDTGIDTPPWQDLLFFLSTFFIQARPGSGFAGLSDAVFETFAGAHAYGRLVRRTVEQHCRAIGVEADIRRLMALFFINQTLREAWKLDRLSARFGLPRIALWLAAETGLGYAEARSASFWMCLFEQLPKRVSEVAR